VSGPWPWAIMASYRPVPDRDPSLDGEIAETTATAASDIIDGEQERTPLNEEKKPAILLPPPAPYPESESGPSFGTPEWEDEPMDEDGKTRPLLEENRKIDNDDNERIDNSGSAEETVGDGEAFVPPAVGRSVEDVSFEASALPPKPVSSRPPYIDYSYTRRVASPLKRRPSILVQSAAIYNQLNSRVALAATATSASCGQPEKEARKSRGGGGGAAVRQVVATKYRAPNYIIIGMLRTDDF
jgi:hypothetical protein